MKERGFKLDGFKWLKEENLDDPDDVPEPEELATEAISQLELAIDDMSEVLRLLENGTRDRQEVDRQ